VSSLAKLVRRRTLRNSRNDSPYWEHEVTPRGSFTCVIYVCREGMESRDVFRQATRQADHIEDCAGHSGQGRGIGHARSSGWTGTTNRDALVAVCYPTLSPSPPCPALLTAVLDAFGSGGSAVDTVEQNIFPLNARRVGEVAVAAKWQQVRRGCHDPGGESNDADLV